MVKITFVVTLDEGVTPHGTVAIAEEIKQMMQDEEDFMEDIKEVRYIIEDDRK